MTLHSALAEAVVLVRADGSHLEGDVSKNATKAGESAGTKMGHGLASTFRRVAGSVLVIEGVKTAIEFADAFEKSRSRLEVVTKNIGGNFDALSGHIDTLDQKLATYGFTNADVEGSVASLETATKSSGKAMKDVALAADIARGRNMSLEEATRILMRVETGHVAMLSKLGIQTKDANGNLLTQKEALTELAQVYGGAASHYADTFAGKQEALKAELGNSAAEIGTSLLPAVIDLAGVLEHDIVPAVVGATHFFEAHRKTLEPLIKDILIFTAAYKAYSLVVKGVAAVNLLLGRSAVTAAAGETVLAGAEERSAVAANAEAVAKTRAAGIGGGAGLGIGIAAQGAISAQGLNAAVQSSKQGGLAGVAGTLGHTAASSPMTETLLAPVLLAKHFLGLGDAKKKDAAATTTDTNAAIINKIAEQHLTVATFNQTKAIKTLTGAVEKHASEILATTGTYDSFRQLLNDLPQSVKQNGRALQGYSDKAIANRQALSQAAQAIFAHVDAMKAQHRSAPAVEAALAQMEAQLRRTATATYGNRAAVDAYLRRVGLLPGQIKAAMAGLKAEGTGAGYDFGNGLVVGLNETTGPVEAAATKLAQAAAAAARGPKGLNSGSPSKVTTKIGHEAGDGLVKGINERKKQVADAATSLAQTFSQTFSSVKSNLQGYADVSGVAGSGVGFFGYEQAKTNDLKRFAHLYDRLEKAGLDAHLLGEFAAAGPAAIGAMQQILAAQHGVGRANRLDRQQARYAANVAGLSAGDDLASSIAKLPAAVEAGVVRALRKHGFDITIHEKGGNTVTARRRAG